MTAQLPADYTFTAADDGAHNLSATLFSTGDMVIDVSDGGGQGNATHVTVRDVAPLYTAPPNQAGSEGTAATLQMGSFVDSGGNDSPLANQVI